MHRVSRSRLKGCTMNLIVIIVTVVIVILLIVAGVVKPTST
ncbi:MAG: hypothetical protein R6W83_09840 [Cryobacterium sp.]